MTGYEILLMKGGEPIATLVLDRWISPIRVPRVLPPTIGNYTKNMDLNTRGFVTDEYEVIPPISKTRYLVAQYVRTVQP